MPYLVDGHNLIPHIPGISLADEEDEQALIHLLEGFANRQRTRIEVFFDQAPPSRAGSKTFGTVKAHFVRQGSTADQALVSRLQGIGKEAKNWTVVTSDREILAEARSLASKTLSSPAFAGMVLGSATAPGPSLEKDESREVSEEEVQYWLDQFGKS
jgi:hypothetical protein